jgi:ribosomal protein L14E/L6E/L27E
VENLSISLGQVVYSKAGRDKGKKFIVLGVLDKEYVLIADGSLRKIEKPKKKKCKHLKQLEMINEDFSKRLYNNLKINNSEIRKWLASIEE